MKKGGSTSLRQEGLLSHRARSARGLLTGIGIGLLATLVGGAAGGLWLALATAWFEGAAALRAAPAFAFYGLFFGGMIAWPASLVVLPALWWVWPERLNVVKRRMLLLLGSLAGGLTLAIQVLADPGPDGDVVGWAMIGAGVVGGAAAGLTFALFVPRPACPK
ncbi:MAG TPA: hypothetical protein VGD88_12665 [Opitutaceae bacterium]